MKSLLDFVPAVAFFVAWLRHDIYVATGVVMVALLAVVAAYWFIDRKLHKVHAFAAVAALVFGGLTLALRDPTFIQFKPSLVYGCMGLVLLGSHVIGSKVLLQRLPQHVLVMPEGHWRRLNAAWALFFLTVAAVNFYVASTLSETVWVHMRTWGYSVMTILFLASTLPFIARYFQNPEHRESDARHGK